jgi:tyrosyl-tRNA synthetase
MHAFGLPKQDILTTDLLIGTDGNKMSKSLPNCILIDDTPFDMYQKLINVRDDLILHYFELATDMTLEEVDVIRKRFESGEHPNKLKEELAQRIIMMYHGEPYNANDVNTIEEIVVESKLKDGNNSWTIAYLLREI